MAHDAIECCSLARRLALQLADGLRNDAGAGADEVDHIRADITAGMNGAVEKRTAATYGCFGRLNCALGFVLGGTAQTHAAC